MEWLKTILEATENAEDLYGRICSELPKNFIPKDKYNQLVEERKQAQAQQAADAGDAVKNAVVAYALSSLSRKAEIKDAGLIKSLIDSNAVTVDENGLVCGLTEQLDEIKSGKPYLFENEALSGKAPKAGESAPVGITKEQFAKMGYKERVELFNNSPEVYNYLSE